MSGKVCIVTGANGGIGLGTALGLAELNATVVIACRSVERGLAALDRVVLAGGDGRVELMLLDLSSQRSIREFAAQFLEQYERIDVLINNAATIPPAREVTEDGLEMQFAVNHLGPFLLTDLLLDRLKSSAPARVVNVSSVAHKGTQLDFEDLQSEASHDFYRTYSRTKLMNILFTYELARRLEGSGVTANGLHPGVVRSQIMGQLKGLAGFVTKYGMYLMTPPRKGARTSLYVATSPDVKGVSGKYFARCREVASSAESHNLEDAKRLWEVSEALAGV